MNSGIKVWLHLVFVLGGFQLIPIKTKRQDDHDHNHQSVEIRKTRKLNIYCHEEFLDTFLRFSLSSYPVWRAGQDGIFRIVLQNLLVESSHDTILSLTLVQYQNYCPLCEKY